MGPALKGNRGCDSSSTAGRNLCVFGVRAGGARSGQAPGVGEFESDRAARDREAHRFLGRLVARAAHDLMTEPLPDGVNVTKYEFDPTAMSVTPLCCDCSVPDRRLSRQLATA